ncbi:pleiotropic regulatory protein RsmS [Marinomonas aquimarina]|nr:pleiotropic regulatory protein RsmS [Marinomonas aquimarina]
MSLDSAPDHIKLAVDLIALLEENEIPNDTAIAALKIVLQDYQQKAASSPHTTAAPPSSTAD